MPRPAGAGAPTDEQTDDTATGPGTSTGGVLLDAAADGTLLRANRGGCGGDLGTSDLGTVEVSTNGGASFTLADIGGLTSVLSLTATRASTMVVVGTDAVCAPTVYSSTDGGKTWESSPGTGDEWHLAAGTSTQVHAPGGSATPGCDVAALVPDQWHGRPGPVHRRHRPRHLRRRPGLGRAGHAGGCRGVGLHGRGHRVGRGGDR